MSERSSFGPELRRAREGRGLSLEEIAERTKVSVSLYRGLENNDLSRWPSGLFRRAFVRNYAAAIGLDPEEVCRRFVRLFPEHEGDVPEMRAVPPPPVHPLPGPEGDGPRLMLADAPSAARRNTCARRLGAAAVDLSIAVVPATVVGLLAGMTWFWMIAALVGATGHLVALAVRGRTPGAMLLLPAPTLPALEDAAHAARRRAEAEGPMLVAVRNNVAPLHPRRTGDVRAAGRRRR